MHTPPDVAVAKPQKLHIDLAEVPKQEEAFLLMTKAWVFMYTTEY